VRREAVVEARDVGSVYEVPLMFHTGGMDKLVVSMLRLGGPDPDLSDWIAMVEKIKKPGGEVSIGIVGKYVDLQDAYKSINEAFVHAGISNDVKVKTTWVDSARVTPEEAEENLRGFDGILIPGGFGERGTEGKFEAVRYARENRVPFFGICLGMQCAVIEFARNVCGLEGANSSEFDPGTPYPVIDLMPEQRDVSQMGATMRLGAWACHITDGSFAGSAYGSSVVHERHRHRYEYNNLFRNMMAEKGMAFSGTTPDGNLVEIVELPDHPWFLGCQFHPELKSHPGNPHPLFRSFVRAAKAYSERTGLLAREER
jgi:CTP synthase